MSERTKRFILYIVLFLLAGLITVGAIWFFTRTKEDGQGTTDKNGFELFPRGNVTDQGEIPDDQTGTLPGSTSRLPRLRMISGDPVSGYTSHKVQVETQQVGTSTRPIYDAAVTYTQRANGHIFETRMEIDTTHRISNTTIPKVYEALYSSSTQAIYRYLNDDGESIRTFSGSLSLSTTTSTSTFQGTFFPNNIESIAIAPGGKDVVYGYENGDNFYLTRSKPDASGAVSIFSSFVKEWKLQWPVLDSIFLTTKADSRYPGILYRINPDTKRFDKLLSDVLGLSATVDSVGEYAFISYSDETTGIRSAFYNLDNRNFTFPEYNTFAEKCVWSTKETNLIYCAVSLEALTGDYPEDWYQGETLTYDIIYRTDVLTGASEIILDEEDLGNNVIDMTHLSLSPDEDYIYFINKRDLTLWSFGL